MLFSILFTLPNYFILTTELDQTSHHQLEVLKLIGNDSLVYSSWLQEVPQDKTDLGTLGIQPGIYNAGLEIDKIMVSLFPFLSYVLCGVVPAVGGLG